MEQVKKLAGRMQWGIWGLATGCVLVFSWLQIEKAQVVDFVNSTKPDLFLKVLLIIYYFCWVGGATLDLNLQQSALVRDPHKGKMPKEAYAVFAAFATCTLVLLWASSNDQRFAAALALFWVVGTAGGAYLNYVLRPMIRDSAESLRELGDYFRLERLLIVARFQLGRWQKVRNAISFSLVILVNVSAFVPSVRVAVAQLVVSIFPDLRLGVIESLITNLMILLFIVITESWIYVKRVEAHTAIRVLEDLRKRYVLNARK